MTETVETTEEQTEEQPKTVTHQIEVEDADEPLEQTHLTNPPTTHDQYKVEGYNVINPEYDGPYLDPAHFDPGARFKFGGDPVQAAEHLEDHDPRAVQINQAKADIENAQERLRSLDFEDKADGRNYLPTADESTAGFKRDQVRVPVEDSEKVENANVPTYDEVNPDAPQPPEVPEPEEPEPVDTDEPEEQPSDSFVNEETEQFGNSDDKTKFS